VYTNQTIKINLLERVNHLNYFLALGKLHTGYSRNFDSYYAVSMRCLNKLQYITSTLVPRLKRPVYKNNRMRPTQIKLRKTNILSMHKEYHQVYKLAKSFAANGTPEKPLTATNVKNLQKTYFFFCEMLCAFAIGHFNFTCDENKQIDFARLNMDFTFKGWKLKLKNVKQALTIEVKKDLTYKIALVPTILDDGETLLKSVKADECFICSPYEDGEKDGLLIDITNIESFRRIQQLVLRAMVHADKKRKECPFCKNKLTLNKEKSLPDRPVYECTSCRTEIAEGYCPETGKTYPFTRIAGLAKTSTFGDDEWLAKRKIEAQMYFRNITDLTDEMEIICPHCGKTH
ncbi:MAG: hypothetical protein HDP34_02355, partial [Clostridia bacterium]|nr:hypothetical protein [Clostridia bacterium]